ncbi:hypothetical protein BU24DRAFT_419252 [Aaosphaeria arxii CBS 175.79]|uniref:Uncharacterized protein n=1 Tax=Aaosphaeria arxii CBS 175.79 TaxID=1450172 RepID=A0A6A5Y263_9PLEO|nr:uncharacterized protein BU24DRAFT_419252 [Aaosphaeria arxii CBS 175.79]KAF2019635.1 hypothetical protein BU24DRAFT_419252 [Aaosphaeria arxii CBS 175.79]
MAMYLFWEASQARAHAVVRTNRPKRAMRCVDLTVTITLASLRTCSPFPNGARSRAQEPQSKSGKGPIRETRLTVAAVLFLLLTGDRE